MLEKNEKNAEERILDASSTVLGRHLYKELDAVRFRPHTCGRHGQSLRFPHELFMQNISTLVREVREVEGIA